VIEDVLDGARNGEPVGAAFASRIFHCRLLAVAPLLQAGVVNVTLAGVAPFTCVRTPLPLNFSVPVPRENGVPAVPPVTSAPLAVIA
jgi:hypothetical protein